MAKKSSHNLIWMDLEMTGLDVDKEVIIEIATLVTDQELNIIGEGPCLAIHQKDDILERMDEWNRTTHNASGLVQKVKSSNIFLQKAEQQTLEFVRKFCPSKTSPLCGNSIGQDRKFLEKYMPKLHGFLHYRNIDATTIKELVLRWYPDGPKPPKKSDAHTAKIDVHESLAELIFYRKHYFVQGLVGEEEPLLSARESQS